MIYKVLYQDKANEVPTRESTKAMYIEADSEIEVRQILQEHSPVMVEYVEELSKAHLAYEKKQDYFKLTEFDA